MTVPVGEPLDPDRLDPAPGDRSRFRLSILATIALGGLLGTEARYALERIIHTAPGSFPWSTFWVNGSGSFVLGVLLTVIVERWPPSRYLRAFAVIGFLGAYTTFSTYTVETALLAKDDHVDIAVAYVAASLLVGLVAVYAGMLVARLAAPRERGT